MADLYNVSICWKKKALKIQLLMPEIVTISPYMYLSLCLQASLFVWVRRGGMMEMEACILEQWEQVAVLVGVPEWLLTTVLRPFPQEGLNLFCERLTLTDWIQGLCNILVESCLLFSKYSLVVTEWVWTGKAWFLRLIHFTQYWKQYQRLVQLDCLFFLQF